MTRTKYEQLKDLNAEYGQETVRFYRRVKEIGALILREYAESLGAEKRVVWGVPPHTEFEPRTDYRDAAYSTYHQNICYLESIFLGISTEIGNKQDDGATWVKTVLEFRPSGNQVIVLVGERGRKFSMQNAGEPVVSEICDAIFDDVKEAFSLELDEAQGRSRIGFTSENS